ncbi:MAG: (Fe-S)-binding protein [Saprospirales bacterium]|nr:(Fe-S)-binding protein [Saprospirales bacterium]MBK8921028.1 (Fe-S)-binding protein [Saprospirales bacterium]
MLVKTFAEYLDEGRSPEILFWVGCAGSFDARAQKVTKAVCEILHHAGVTFAILGKEERCTGDPARRAGNEFLFQMTAMMNIETLNRYGVQKIVTACPHCFNVLKNEYPELGGHYDVIHHTQLINELIRDGRLKMKESGDFTGKRITYHDSCYLGRANGVYAAPRALLEALDADLVEMKRARANGLCCGAGGAQMWKEDEPGEKRINIERVEEALSTGAAAIAANCPFCITMLQDGLKAKEQNEKIPVYDLSELILNNLYK